MTKIVRSETATLRLIEGSRRDAARPSDALPRPPAPEFSAPELAAEMAELFAMALLRDTGFAALSNPHATVRVDAGAEFTLHEVLCDLRNLSWNDPRALLSSASRVVAYSRASQGESDHRRAIRWNGDGQLTLQSLFRNGVATVSGPARVSGFLAEDHAVATPSGPVPGPGEDAQMSDWVCWCAAQSGAGLRIPSQTPAAALPATPADLARRLARTPIARPFHNAALRAMSSGTRFDNGLQGAHGASGWTASRLFALLAEAETLAHRVAFVRGADADRLSRPAVTAARMSVHLAREERAASRDGAAMRGAAEELAATSPELLGWMGRANTKMRDASRLSENLFLPLLQHDDTPPHPADFASLVSVAGALATILKAVFDTEDHGPLRLEGERHSDPDLARDADLMVSNAAMVRSVLSTHYPGENHQDMRIGERIALNLIRHRLQTDNRSAALGFTDFDGRAVSIVAHPRSFGRGHAELYRDGALVAWPQDEERPAAHLTAVV